MIGLPFRSRPMGVKTMLCGRQGLENPSAWKEAEEFSYIPAGTLHSKKSENHQGGLPLCCEMGS